MLSRHHFVLKWHSSGHYMYLLPLFSDDSLMEFHFNWFTACLLDQLIYFNNWQTDRLTIWWTNGLATYRLSNWLTAQVTVPLANWLADWLTDWLTNRPTDWLADWLTDQLADWLVEWLTVWLIDRLKKFEKTNAKFGRFNDLSAARFLHLNQQLKHHTKMLLDMKKDLDSVFRRIRWRVLLYKFKLLYYISVIL